MLVLKPESFSVRIYLQRFSATWMNVFTSCFEQRQLVSLSRQTCASRHQLKVMHLHQKRISGFFYEIFQNSSQVIRFSLEAARKSICGGVALLTTQLKLTKFAN